MFKPSRRLLAGAAIAVALPLSFLPTGAAQAQRSRNTTPPAPTVIPVPTVIGSFGEGRVQFFTSVLPRGRAIQAELVSAPNAVTVSEILGIVYVSPGLPGSTYVVRVRTHQFYDGRTYAATDLNSAWVTASYTTPAQFEIPPAPTNLRVLSSDANTTTVTWDAPPATATTPVGTYGYLVSINGATPIPPCPGGAYNFCPPQTYQFAKLAPGASLRIQVQALNLAGNFSALSAPFVVNG